MVNGVPVPVRPDTTQTGYEAWTAYRDAAAQAAPPLGQNSGDYYRRVVGQLDPEDYYIPAEQAERIRQIRERMMGGYYTPQGAWKAIAKVLDAYAPARIMPQQTAEQQQLDAAAGKQAIADREWNYKVEQDKAKATATARKEAIDAARENVDTLTRRRDALDKELQERRNIAEGRMAALAKLYEPEEGKRDNAAIADMQRQVNEAWQSAEDIYVQLYGFRSDAPMDKRQPGGLGKEIIDAELALNAARSGQQTQPGTPQQPAVAAGQGGQAPQAGQHAPQAKPQPNVPTRPDGTPYEDAAAYTPEQHRAMPPDQRHAKFGFDGALKSIYEASEGTTVQKRTLALLLNAVAKGANPVAAAEALGIYADQIHPGDIERLGAYAAIYMIPKG